MYNLNDLSVGAIKKIIKENSIEKQVAMLEELEADTRKGVRDLASSIKKRKSKFDLEVIRLENMELYEKELYLKDVFLIAGIDEVGRGPLAGPVVTAAVILKKNQKYEGINDSKKVPEKRRNSLYQEIIDTAVCYSFGIATPEEIDEINILNATKLAMKRAVEGLSVTPEHLLIDAVKLDDIDISQTSIIKGDEKSITIAAASIIAKVKRDEMMVAYDKEFPGYDFSSNKGYGTSAHYKGLNAQGITTIHRKSFVKDFV